MECRKCRLRQSATGDQLTYALTHLRRSFVRECDRENRVGRLADVLHQMRNPIRNDARLPRPRAGEDEQRAVHGFSGFALLRVEFVE